MRRAGVTTVPADAELMAAAATMLNADPVDAILELAAGGLVRAGKGY